MGNVEIPEWLKGLPLAPEFHPTDTEFADPIAYISKIEKEASVFGICKVIPPVPKPSKRYVFGNLSKSLLRSSELGSLESSSDGSGSSSKSVSGVKGGDGDIRAVFTTRQQELGRSGKRVRGLGDAFPPVAQKQVWQSGEVYTLEQFELKSKAFSRSVLSTVKDVSPFVIEALFWKAASEKPIYVEYANDVPGSAFGESEGQLRYLYGHKRRRRRVFARNNQGRSYGVKQEVTTERNHCNGTEMDFSSPHLVSVSEPSGECTTEPPTSFSSETLKSTKPRGLCSNSEMEGTSGWKLSNSPWNLQVIAHSAGSLTRFMLDDIPGVTSPMVYIGMLFSWFAWHVEDHELHSLNFLHTGSPKTWYAVPGDSAFAFEEVIRNHAYGGDIDRLAALASLGEKTTLLSPEIVLASGIPCCRLVQNPGEFVVTFPRAYHVGFSHGFNCGEAANFGTPQWLKIAREAAVRRAAMDHLPMLSHQQLLYLLTMSFVSRVPRSLLPGVRSSRLKDRQREERELLVKKAFIEDMLKENTLLNILLSKDPTFRAVLWDPNSLPLFNKDSSQQTGTVPDATVLQENDHKIDLSEELSFNMETASYLDDDDLCSDYQVDSGLVACVACGILGYPFMSVIQPSKDAAMEIWPMDMVVETLEPANSKLTDYCDAKEGSVLAMLTKIDERWNSTSGFLRPCIFCLEHAVQVEELLRPKGGANVLVICHSDYQKIKANAAVVAEEIKMAFNYKEVTLDSASQQDLNLINLAIDAAERETSKQDWTSKLSINLRYCIKSRKGSLAKQIEHALKLAGLFSDATQGSNIAPVNWSSRRCRSKLKKNDVKEGKSGDSCQLKKNDVTVGKACDGNQFKSNGSSGRKDSVLLQYSRRKFKNKQETVEANRNVMTAVVSEAERTSEMGFESCTLASDCTEPHSVEVFDCFDSDKLENNANLRHTEDPPMPCTDPENRSTLPLVIENPGLKNINGADGMETDEKFSSSESMKEKLEYVEPKSGERSKRKREIALLSEDELNQNGFARSPCEGLRPRNRIDITLVSEEQQSTQKVKESVACSDEDASFRCDIEDCKMRFKTRVELSLHKRNRCPHEQCGKRFRSHKYAVLHQRVHIKDRPLKCTWEGCTMTFKWAWARTEHLRLHTGERPYQCKIEGCGLTFRFVSDFSRHRRKTGHYVNPPSS